jgi:tetratricopeptide (TPR) repeat protein
MSYWKGLGVAVAIDLLWIIGFPILASDGKLPVSTYKEQVSWPMSPDNAGVIFEARSETPSVAEIVELSEQLDSLMLYLQEHPDDVDALQHVAQVYANHGWWTDAIGPLARAIQLDPERWSLWAALDRALENAGMATISDEDLTLRAQGFVEAIAMWGHGC